MQMLGVLSSHKFKWRVALDKADILKIYHIIIGHRCKNTARGIKQGQLGKSPTKLRIQVRLKEMEKHATNYG